MSTEHEDQVAGWSAMIDLLPVPCAVLDRAGCVSAANKAWGLAGVTVPSGVADVAAGRGGACTVDVAATGPLGERWFRAVASGLPEGGASVVLVEITDHRRTEADLSDSRARLSELIESAMDAIITIDESQRVVVFNRAAERIFGVPAGEAIGKSLDRFIPQQHRGAHAQHVREFGQTGVTTRAMGQLGTLVGVRADGKEFPIEASISQGAAAGHRFYSVILRDVSERQQMEAQLTQAQKMEGIGRLAGGVAHDFNNLLMAIFNFLLLASRRLEDSHPAQQALTQAREAAERAATLTRQLLSFARRRPVSAQVVSPREVVARLEPMLRRLIGEDLDLRAVLADDTGNVMADGGQLEQVVMNLAVNARDAMPRGGCLTIGTSNVNLDEAYCRTRPESRPGEHVVIEVKDTGTGMSREVMSRLFEPYFTTKPVGKGTGLGLAMCHGIVKQSSGHIAVTSQEGRGTCVRVLLPRVRDAAAPGPRTDAGAPAGGTELVLLVEDSDTVRDLAAQALRGAGYTVLSASKGAEAIALAGEAGPIALLVTDVVMPEMSGVEVAAALRRRDPGLAVVYMSGYMEQQAVEHGLGAERSAFLNKPFSTDVLLRTARELLDGARGAGVPQPTPKVSQEQRGSA